MKELIKIVEKKIGKELTQTINARELHEFLGSGKDFTNWIKARIKKYCFLEGEDFIVLLTHLGEQKKFGNENLLPQSVEQKGSGGHNKTEYFLTLDMAKELAMVEATQQGRKARKYFIECEKRLLKLEKNRSTKDWLQIREENKLSNKMMNRMLQDVRKENGKKTEKHHYQNENKLINAVMTGNFKGIDRDKLSGDDLVLMQELQLLNTKLIARNFIYPERKTELFAFAENWRLSRPYQIEEPKSPYQIN